MQSRCCPRATKLAQLNPLAGLNGRDSSVDKRAMAKGLAMNFVPQRPCKHATPSLVKSNQPIQAKTSTTTSVGIEHDGCACKALAIQVRVLVWRR